MLRDESILLWFLNYSSTTYEGSLNDNMEGVVAGFIPEVVQRQRHCPDLFQIFIKLRGVRILSLLLPISEVTTIS